MKIGSIVRLKEKAVKGFYSTPLNFDMYCLGYGELSTTNFVSYVDDVISFDDGSFGGIVIAFTKYGDAEVKFRSRLTGELKTSYYDLVSLEVVME